MNTLFTVDFWATYMLPSALALAVFYLLYKVVVRNDKHFKIRRFTILGFLVFAMALPFLNIQIPVGGGWGVLQIPVQNFINELPVFTVFAEGNPAVAGVEIEHALSLPPIFNIVGGIYLFVVLFFIGRIVFGIRRLAEIRKNGRRDKVCLVSANETIIINPNIPTAFSFFKTIFIPETWENTDEKDMVLAHERVHVNQKHSWDLMLMEIVCAVQFFNPFVWLLKREMRLNHEYLADKGALENNKNPEHYFQFLFQETVGNRTCVKQPTLVHSFTYSPLKNRIMMQLSKPARLLNQVRYLAFIPVILALSFLFACQESPEISEDALFSEVIQTSALGNPIVLVDGIVFDVTIANLNDVVPVENVETITVLRAPSAEAINRLGLHNLNTEDGVIIITTRPSERALDHSPIGMNLIEFVEADGRIVDRVTQEPTDDVFIIVETSPEFPGGDEARITFMQENVRYPQEARDAGIQGTVFVSFVVERDGRISNVRTLRGIGGGADEEAVRVVSMMPNWTPGKQGGEPVRVQFNMPIRFTLAGETE